MKVKLEIETESRREEKLAPDLINVIEAFIDVVMKLCNEDKEE